MKPEVPQVLLGWEETIGVLLDTTEKFPKGVRFTFAQRIDHAALDVLEALTTARYAPRGQKQAALKAASHGLVRLRTLVRLSHQRRYLSNAAYERLSRRIEVTGSQVGGWFRAEGIPR